MGIAPDTPPALAMKARLGRAAGFLRRLVLGRPVKISVGVLAAVLIIGAFPKQPLNRGLSFSREVYDRHGRLLRLTLSSDEKYRRWVPLNELSTDLVEAVLLQEDRFFFFHPGVNPVSLVKGFWQSYAARDGFRMGGSTISMQLARMLYRIDSRTVKGKAFQALKAMQLELLYSKNSILEAYLNLVPCGGNVEGFPSASLIYFSRETDKLSPPEIMTLCVIPKSPARRSLAGAKAGDMREADKARRRLFVRWVRNHPGDERYGGSFPVFDEIRPVSSLPFLAPHFVDAVLRSDPIGNKLLTTLDLRTQKLVETQLRDYVRQKKNSGILNAAALLIDVRDVSVRAAVGSADFFDRNIEGQVNGTTARRSPGSTLKPFIYSLALDQGLIHPMTMLKDTPVSYGGFNPENFDRDFSGPVHAKDALVRSRNIPAVNLAMRLTSPGLYGFLKKAGVAPLKDENYYGLALALGGVEISMEKLGELYAMLPNGGDLRPLRYFKDGDNTKGEQLLSREAAFMVLDMLKDNPRPGQGFRQEWTASPLPVSWKTGTSYGFRDAWSVGVFGHYVLLVWIGNFNREANPAFVGVEAAAPLMFRVVDALRAQEKELGPLQPAEHKAAQVEVCAVSGQIPGPYCRKRADTWFIPGRSPIKTCEIHRGVLMDLRTGRRACGNDKKWTRLEIYEFWPSDILKVFQAGGVPRKLPPPENPDCPFWYYAETGAPPIITSPQSGVIYNLRTSKKDDSRIPFTAVTDADARTLYWFMNQNFAGRSKSGEPFFISPVPGRYVVRVVDDRGRSDLRDISIQVVD